MCVTTDNLFHESVSPMLFIVTFSMPVVEENKEYFTYHVNIRGYKYSINLNKKIAASSICYNRIASEHCL